ncbi:hypothetical protein R1flu_024859 [Riccia fluitans]|uniref:Serine aminopeptidase S33 domain-containing protein n=1 Tax=Riccia fluitans TaxID=41844 RepID=A0ABD1XW93_9MARC
MEVIRMNHPHHHHQQTVCAAASTVLVSGGSRSRRISLLNVLPTTREVTFPVRAIRTLAVAISSLMSFIPIWKLYLPGYWLSKSGLHFGYRLFKQGRSATGAAAATAAAAAVKAYNEVNDPQPEVWTWSSSVDCDGRITRGVVLLLHGLNEHSGRYGYFASKLNARGFGVFGMDWIGHGGSDGLHGYVESLDHVVHDTKLFMKEVTAEYPNVPLFLFGHSTGGAIALKTSVVLNNEPMLNGVILTSPAVRVQPSHPIVAALAPIFSLLLPRYQFKGASRSGATVSRDPKALVAKYSDPLVYTGPVRIRTGTEILRIGSFLTKNMEKITTPFLVMHGSLDQVTDPEGSRELYSRASFNLHFAYCAEVTVYKEKLEKAYMLLVALPKDDL